METVETMRYPIIVIALVAACSDPVRTVCPSHDTRAWCEDQCKTGDASAEVCSPGEEVACLDECLRCEPDTAWCPR